MRVWTCPLRVRGGRVVAHSDRVDHGETVDGVASRDSLVLRLRHRFPLLRAAI